ncbi:putative disease resistance RPP13-like protein 1 [Lactuca sativa]|uniref:putative disease resistance RPP13-like protein 1 n=1 Tax=Lactuca sativa TaxID=4236 RepID=UPI001C688623|nr:putative disease resistance RPP13-like protein 1 [Lactuca sativa]
MAEIVLSAFLTVVFEKLASEALKKIAGSKGVGSKLKKLERSLIQIKALLNDASQKEITDEAVKVWLNGLQHLAYDIDDLLDDLATEAMHRKLADESGATTSKVRKLLPTCCTNFSRTSKRMERKLDDITTKLQELVEEKNNLGLGVITNEKPKIERYEASLVDTSGIVGRESEKNKLLKKLLGGRDEFTSQSFSILPIVGMGGVGKTTLARMLYDEKEVKDHFKLRAWVCVSDEFNIFNISKVIYQSVTGEKKEFEDLNLLQEALKKEFTNQLFLIVLDDVWSESYGDWEKLVAPFLVGSPGSRIIMTTRKEQLLRKLGFSHQDPLESLSQDDALSLFAQHALGVDNFDSHPTLRPHGELFVKKCDGLPLALRTLGRLLRTKTDEEQWKELLDSEIWRLGKSDEIVPALRLSYNDLSATLKLLFAYCSLFPKDYLFDKEELILLWMAEGFLHQPTTNKSKQRLGLEYFEELLSRSFFQHAPNNKSLFVMHDLLNDLATFVAGDFFSRLDIGMNQEFRKEVLQKHRHMSLVCKDYMVYKRFEPFKGAKNLRTFLALSGGLKESWKIFYLSNKVLSDLLQELPLLRVLSLSNLRISEVPEVVGSMKHLRYLNLSQTWITHLPENVCNLYNLQTLIVSDCHKLIKLPESFSKLKNLQHFDMRGSWKLKKMPLGIGELKSLHTLSSDIGLKLTELKNLQNLHGKVCIGGLGKVENAVDACEVNFSQKRFSELELDWGDEFNVFRTETHEKEVFNELKPHNGTLEKLSIVSYRGIEFPDWVADLSFRKLTHVLIYRCEECTSLPRLGQLPSLKELIIGGMSKVKVVDLELLGTDVAFPSLEILCFKSMSGWEEWSTNSGAFPCLQELRIEDCPNLLRVSLEALPSLRVLKLRKCGHGVLKNLVDVASSITKLEINDISGLTDELWRGVTKYLGAVEEVSIRGCDDIKYVWESEAEASKVLVNLKMLALRKCKIFMSLGEKEEDNCGSSLTSFRELGVSDCNNLEHCSCPESVEMLDIWNCDSITSVSFPTGGQKLKLLSVGNCNKLLEKGLGGREKTRVLINSKMQMLESVFISDWPNLKSISELSCFIHLNRLYISDCLSMESFPDHELPNLTSLTELTIQKCTSMDASFPRGLWPPKLCALDIGRLKKPISEWGPQNFPTSLVRLRLYAGPFDDLRSFGESSHLFPSSLTTLGIFGFEKLESVSTGLQHLTSLQNLSIRNCPKTIDLPEKLLPSLLVLWTEGCPNLKERISRGGSYWPHISLIPSFDNSDYQLQV